MTRPRRAQLSADVQPQLPALPDPEALDDRLKRVEMVDDPLEYMMRCVLALAPSFSQAMAQAVLERARQEHGGEVRWIGRGADDARRRRNVRIRNDHQMGERIPLLMRRYGLTRSQIHRILASDE